MKKGWIIVSFLAILGMSMVALESQGLTATPAKPIVLKASVHIGGTSPYPMIMEKAIDLIKERSGGRIKFEYFPAGSLYNLQQGSKALADGLVQLASFKAGYFEAKFGLVAEISNLPLNYPSDGFLRHLRDPGGFFDWAAPYYARNKVKLLSCPEFQPVGINSKRPVRKMEDLKGMLVRCVPGTAAKGFKLLGAEPVFISAGDIYEGLLRGTVDATNTPITSVVASKLYEAARYYTDVAYCSAGSAQGMNLEAFNSLPPDLQKIVVDAYRDAEQMVFAKAPEMMKRDLEVFKAEKGEVLTLDDAELARWEAAVQPIFNELAAKYGDEWKRFVRIRENMKK